MAANAPSALLPEETLEMPAASATRQESDRNGLHVRNPSRLSKRGP
jgi:hypothetical protein